MGAAGTPGILAEAETVGDGVEDDMFMKRSKAIVKEVQALTGIFK